MITTTTEDEMILDRADEMAATLVAHGAALPEFIASLPVPFRFTAVGTLYAAGYFPQHVITGLLFEPETVELVEYEDDTDVDEPVPYTLATTEEEPLTEWELEQIIAALPGTGSTMPLPFETVAADADAELDAIYAEAASIVAESPEAERYVALTLGVAGHDWPRGSGNYNGGTPAAEWGEEGYTEAVRALGFLGTVFEQMGDETDAA